MNDRYFKKRYYKKKEMFLIEKITFINEKNKILLSYKNANKFCKL